MYIESVPNRNSPPAVLLRESFRDNGKVRKRTLANLSKCPAHAIDALKAALKGEPAPTASTPLSEQFEIVSSLPHGHVAAVLGTIKRLGLPRLLDRSDSPERKIALALIAARILFPSSKLATLRLLAPEAILNSQGQNEGAPPRQSLNLTPSSTLAEELGVDISTLTLADVYGAMRWLFARQKRIESGLAKEHLKEGCLALYDLTSTYYEGSTCSLAKRGYSRDKKKGKLQINFGLLCDERGRPISCEVFAGNVGDPNTVSSQAHKLRKQFGLKKVVLVGDRGMLTQARIDEDLRHLDGLAWISALNHKSVNALVEEGSMQPELFDDYGVAEIASPSYPEERLVVCHNPALSKKRAEKRIELMAVTELKLAEIQKATQRQKNAYRGKDRIAQRIQRDVGKYKMLKYYELKIEEDGFEFERNEESVIKEAAIDGFYIIRAGKIDKDEMESGELVDSYKKLSNVERAFRTLKSVDLRVRPIHHREEEMVRAHIFLCMLAYYVEWHMKEALAAMLFTDENKDEAKAARKCEAEPVEKSPEAKRKADEKTDSHGRPLHSFATLMVSLQGIVRNRIEPGIKGIPTFTKETRPEAIQRHALDLLGLESTGC